VANGIPKANSSTLGVVKIGGGLTAQANGNIKLTPATHSTIGGVIAGAGIAVDANGVISAYATLPPDDSIGYVLSVDDSQEIVWQKFTGVYNTITLNSIEQTPYIVTANDCIILADPNAMQSDVTIVLPIDLAIQGHQIFIKNLEPGENKYEVVITTEIPQFAILEDPSTQGFLTHVHLTDKGQAHCWVHDGNVYRMMFSERNNPIFYNDVNDYAQVAIKNKNGNENASSDLVLYNDTGDEQTGAGPFIDIGIDSSTYSNSTYSLFGHSDGYVYTDNNLLIGTQAENKSVTLFAGGTLANNRVMTINSSSVDISVGQNHNWVFNANGNLTSPSNGALVTSVFISDKTNVFDELFRPLLNPNALDINADGGTSISVFAVRDESFTGGGSTTVFGKYEAALDGGFSYNNRHSSSFIDGGGSNQI
jgi:hypothetical protein